MRRIAHPGDFLRKFEISSRTALAISVPILVVVYLAYLIIVSRSVSSTSGASHKVVLEATSLVEPEGGPAAGFEFDGEFIALNEEAPLPNKGRSRGSDEITGDFGTRSKYYGDVQRERQRWLIERAEGLRSATDNSNGGHGDEKNKTTTSRSLRGDEDMGGATVERHVSRVIDEGATAGVYSVREALTGFYEEGEGGHGSGKWDKVEGNDGTISDSRRGLLWRNGGNGIEGYEGGRGKPAARLALGEVVVVFPGPRETAGVAGGAALQGRSATNYGVSSGRRSLSLISGMGGTSKDALEERIARLELGAKLWRTTYVPPIEPTRWQELVDKWSSSSSAAAAAAAKTPIEDMRGRILYVVTSYDRGDRLGAVFRGQDKLDYVLMMFDEMREACEAGFRPQVHLITAWDPSGIVGLAADRLYCERTKSYVPFSYEEHPHSIGNNLSIKHRVYMRPRINDFDVFLQVEDDMVLTLNHIMLYQDESERLKYRRGPGGGNDEYNVPGFIRIEPGADGGAKGIREDWFEWEVLLSRLNPLRLDGAGTYIRLGDSKVIKTGGNNQGMWMATREQLEKLGKNCQYLRFFNYSQEGHVETHSGSLQMFSKKCGIRKVFPATHFEDFLVHHRANNKNGRRGESIPGVPISMLRLWAQQFVRDESFLVKVN